MAFMSLAYLNEVIRILEECPELKKSVVGIAKQCACACVGTAVGGICAGRLGAACGGVMGVCMGYKTADDYLSVIAAVREMSDDEKYQLQRRIQTLVGSDLIEDVVRYIQNEVQRNLLMGTLREATGQNQRAKDS